MGSRSSAGYDVAMSGSGAAEHIALTVEVLAPGARAISTDEVVQHADLIVLAAPTRRGSQWHPGKLRASSVGRSEHRDLHPLAHEQSELDVESPVPHGAAAHLHGVPHAALRRDLPASKGTELGNYH